MRKVIRKLFWAWDFDKEEKWLNEMASKGLALCAVGFCRYEFEQCKPGEYAVCLQMLENKPQHAESEKYIEFVEETGAEHVGSYLTWVYFRKKKEDGPFELLSDYASRIKHLSRIIKLIGVIGVFNLMAGCYNLFLYGIWGYAISLLGLINIALTAFAGYGVYRLWKKCEKLKKEQQVFE